MHRAAWPTRSRARGAIGGADAAGALALERAALVLGEVRKTKSEGKRPLTTPVTRLVVRDTAAHLAALRTSAADLRQRGSSTRSSCRRHELRCERDVGRAATMSADRITAGAWTLDGVSRDLVAARSPKTSARATSPPRPPCPPTRRAAACSWRSRRCVLAGHRRRRRDFAAVDRPCGSRARRGRRRRGASRAAVIGEVRGPARAAADRGARRAQLPPAALRRCHADPAVRRGVAAGESRSWIRERRRQTLRASRSTPSVWAAARNHRFGLVRRRSSSRTITSGWRAGRCRRRRTRGQPARTRGRSRGAEPRAGRRGPRRRASTRLLVDNLPLDDVRGSSAPSARPREGRDLGRRDARPHRRARGDRRRLRLGRRADALGARCRHQLRD